MKQKLLLVADTYYPKVDGTLKFMEEFLRRAKNDFEISLLVPYLGTKKGENITYIQPSKIFRLSGYPNMKFSFQNLRKIKKAVQESDLVFVQGPALISYLSIYYAHKYEKKTFFYVHVLTWELIAKFLPPLLNRLFFKIVKKISISLYNRCDKIIVPYHELQQALHKAGVKSAMVIGRLGVDIDLFSPAKNKAFSKRKIDLDPEKFVIGYVGRLSKEKNVSLLLEAFKKIRNQKDIFLLMVGDGPERDDFRKTTNCKVTGFVDNVHNYLKAMDIFIMPSLTETTSLATLEAMSSGVPVIATKVGFMQKYIVKDYNGVFFPRNSSTMLKVKVEKLMADQELRARLGSNARRTVAYSFSWERSINKIKRILME